MIEQLEALRALKDEGTTARAAVRLRVTQSAVSKRIAALQAEVGVPLIETAGRGVRLTPAGERLLDGALPLLAALRDVVGGLGAARSSTVLRFAASESLLSAWLPEVLAKALARTPDVRIELHAHRGPVLVERVRSGDYDLAACVAAGAPRDVVEREMGDEPMAIVPSRLDRKALAGADRIEAWTIEERSLTGQILAARLRQRTRPWKVDVAIVARLESFASLVQVARAGLAHALVPRGLALSMGVPASSLVDLPGLTRPLALVARQRTLERPAVASFVRALQSSWPR